MADNQPGNTLEATLSGLQNNDEPSIRKALRAFVQSKVFVKLDQPWDGKAFPRTDMRLLLVTDGENKDQPMLAVFTSAKHSEVYKEEDMGPFKYAVEVDSAWACLGVPENAGVMVNPNSTPNFRISPAVARVLRETAEKDVAAKTTPPPVANTAPN